MLAILATTSNEALCLERLRNLEKSKRDGGDAAAADRVKAEIIAGTGGCGFAFELPDRTKSWDREMLKGTTHTSSNGAQCISVSRLKRTAALNGIMQWMGLANDMTDPDLPPPSDSQLLAAYYSKLLAKQRWSKANSALGALRAMKLSGGIGALTAAPAPAADSPTDSPSDSPVHPKMVRGQRMSVSFLKGDSIAKNLAEKNMAKLPKATDIKNFLRELNGHFAFCILDIKQEFAFAALSQDANVELYAGVGDDGSLMFTTELTALPKDCQSAQIPKGHYFLGRYNGRGLDDLVFLPFIKSTTPIA